MRIIICGGGVIGAALAYELTRRDADVTLIERWRVAGSASGKSGGFLARDWCDGTPVAPLARRSFDLHQEWADRLGNPYGYRRVDTIGAALGPRMPSANATSDLGQWLTKNATHRQKLGTTDNTAALDPEAFTSVLVEAAISAGGALETATVTGVLPAAAGASPAIVTERGETIRGDAIVLAMGPWSILAAQWVPLPPVYGLKGHSLIFRPRQSLPAEAIFAEYQASDGEVHGPEIVARADGTVYVCGLPGTAALPLDPADVRPEPEGTAKLVEIATQLVPSLNDAEILAEQACFRPVTADGMPLIGAIPGASGIYVATGHSVWGMLNAPGTAEALSDLILGAGTAGVDLSPFAPDRMAPLDPSELAVEAG